MEAFLGVLDSVLDITTMLFALLILVGLVSIVVLYVLDVTQNQQTIRKNYPVIGRLRYVFEHLGVFFRQYFLFLRSHSFCVASLCVCVRAPGRRCSVQL